MRKFLVIFAVVANLVLADAVAKELAFGMLKPVRSVCIIPSFLNLAYVENRGCAWGMLQGSVWPLAAFGAVALGLLIWKRRKVFGSGMLAVPCECLLYAGIIGNLIDRAMRGFVIDFLDFHWAEAYHFPCFNLADAFISIAAAILVLGSFRSPDRE